MSVKSVTVEFFERMLADDTLIVKLYFKFIDDMKMKSSTISCRNYQLMIILAFLYLSRYKISIDELIDEGEQRVHINSKKANTHKTTLKNIIQQINYDQTSLLYKIIVEQEIIESELSEIITIIFILNESIFTPIDEFFSVCPLCIYRHRTHNEKDIIQHYFTIISYLGRKYLCSSYGSENVSVPPTIIEITDLDELNFLFKNLKNIKTLDKVKIAEVRKLFIKYFFPRGINKYYNDQQIEGEPKLKFKKLDFETGKEMEWDYIKDHPSSFSFAYIFPYLSELNNLLEQFGTKRRKSKKKTRRKSKKKTRRKSKKKTRRKSKKKTRRKTRRKSKKK